MKSKSYLYWGITITLSACAILVFYDTLFHSAVVVGFFKKLGEILTPAIYGLAMAYLLTPTVNSFDKLIQKLLPKTKKSYVRLGSMLLSWTLVIILAYLFFSFLIPELETSLKTLWGNLESYYNVVYNWVMHLVENNPELLNWVRSNFSSYYNQLINWVTGSWLPQAQSAILAVTGGVVSLVSFVLDFFVGICVSVYVLGRKETFGLHARKLLRSITSEKVYRRAMKDIAMVDRIFFGFIRGKLLDSLIIGILCFFFSSLFKFPYAPLISVIVGVTNVIPFFGPFLGAIPSAFLILLVSPLQCFYFVVFIFVLQQFDGNILGPAILGGSTGLSGFWVIVAILVGGGFFGVLGMFLGVPVFACIHTVVSEFCRSSLARKGITDNAYYYSSDGPEESENAQE